MYGMESILRRIFRRFGYTLTKQSTNPQYTNQLSFHHVLDMYFQSHDLSDFFFLQIGANDGKTNDHLYPFVTKYQLHGVAVEPQPTVYPLLTETYKMNPQVKTVQAAIAGESGTQILYRVKQSYTTDENFSRVTGLATFKKDTLRRTIVRKIPKGSNPDDYIEEISSPTLSFGDLIARTKVDHINLLQIDCEGYDYEILKLFDFERFSPDIINFESVHFSDDDRTACEALLMKRGYSLFHHGIDTCAYKITSHHV